MNAETGIFQERVFDQFLAAPFLAEQVPSDLAAGKALYAHFKESEGIGCDQQTDPPCSNNAIQTVCNENMYLVPTVFKMN